MPRILSTTGFPGLSAEWERAHPFARFLTPESVRAMGREAARAFRLPRNVPVHLCVLAAALLRERPDTVIFTPNVDSRDCLALYETARSLTGSPTEIQLPGEPFSRSSGVGVGKPAGRRTPREMALRLERETAGGRGLPWSEAYEVILTTALGLPVPVLETSPAGSDGGSDEVAAGSGAGSLPPKKVEASRLGPRPAIFGDWLLGASLLEFLEKRGCPPVFVQAAYDAVASSRKSAVPTDLFLPFQTKVSGYQAELTRRRADSLIFVHAPFSTTRLNAGVELSTWGLPLLVLETSLPGHLPETGRIRLENFLARLRQARSGESPTFGPAVS